MAPRTATDVVVLEDLLRAQWLRLRDWVDRTELASATTPSVLAGWTVADVVGHLGRAMSVLSAAQPADPGTVPLTLAEYVRGYPDDAAGNAERTRTFAREIADDPLREVERMAEDAFAQLVTLRGLGTDPVVRVGRGPVQLSTLVVSRLLELVVHGDDLARSAHLVPGDPGPLEAGAVDVVADALLGVLVDRGGWAVDVDDPLTWIRLACGRVPLDGTTLARALDTRHTGDSLPDLGTVLPLL